MIFLGNLCGYEDTVEVTPSYVEDVNYIELTGGIYDDFYITSVSDYERNEDDMFIWTWDTILYAPFEGNAEAGNVDYTLSTTSYILIKRRKSSEFEWQTIYVQPISTLEDFDMRGVDKNAKSNVNYEYASVPVYQGVEGVYSTMLVESIFDKLYIVGKDKMYGTGILKDFVDTTRNVPSSTSVLLNSKYPIYISNTIANYDTGTVTACFVDVDEDTCELLFDDYARTPYQKEIIDFLSDRKPKLLKLSDGRMWLIMVTGNPTDSADEHYQIRNISFDWTEIGDCESEEDLYNNGLSDVSEEWWVR